MDLLKKNWLKIGIPIIAFIWIISLLSGNNSTTDDKKVPSQEANMSESLNTQTPDDYIKNNTNSDNESPQEAVVLESPKTQPSVEDELYEITPIPTSQPEPEPNNNRNYICSYNAYNCSDFNTHLEAQKAYEYCGGVSNDIHILDSDKDGSACEILP